MKTELKLTVDSAAQKLNLVVEMFDDAQVSVDDGESFFPLDEVSHSLSVSELKDFIASLQRYEQALYQYKLDARDKSFFDAVRVMQASQVDLARQVQIMRDHYFDDVNKDRPMTAELYDLDPQLPENVEEK